MFMHDHHAVGFVKIISKNMCTCVILLKTKIVWFCLHSRFKKGEKSKLMHDNEQIQLLSHMCMLCRVYFLKIAHLPSPPSILKCIGIFYIGYNG
jgi:hypothetical protein